MLEVGPGTGRLVRREGGDFVEFFAAGTPAAGEYHCAECSYGITLHSELPVCPMCGGESWEQADWSPFTRRRLNG
jgi:hypothetical protein